MKVIPFILQVMKPFRLHLTFAVVGNFATAACMILQPLFIKNIINAAYAHDANGLIHNALYFGILNLLEENCIRRIDSWMELLYVPRLRNVISQKLFARACRQPHSFFLNNFAGSLIGKQVDCVSVIPQMIKTFLDGWLTGIALVCGTLFMLYRIHPSMAFGLAIWATFFMLTALLTLSRHHSLTLAARAGVKVVAAHVDAITNMINVRLFARQKEEMHIIKKTHTDYAVLSQARRWFVLKVDTAQSVGFWLYHSGCTIVLIALRAQGHITPGDFGLILAINIAIVDHLWRLGEQMRNFFDDWGKVEAALETFYAPLSVQDLPAAPEIHAVYGNISFQNVHFAYHPEKPIFEGLNVEIPSGQKVGLVGPSGSGKSTFVSLLLRLYDIQKGTIYLDKQPTAYVTQNSLRKAITYVPQEPSLFHRSVKENIAYGSPQATIAEIETAARSAAAHDFIMALPRGYDTLVGERGTKLSGGQRQRIALARALLKQAPVLILDEATSQLDTITERTIQSALADFFENTKKENRGMPAQTTIVIAHRLSTLLHMDRILVFDGGRIVQDGTHAQLIAQEGLYKTLWETQTQPKTTV